MSPFPKQTLAVYIRNFIFGVEDSLVSTVGLLSGVAAAGVSQKNIILTGVVLIFVEAFSMAAGAFLSEHSAEEYLKNGKTASFQSTSAAIIMFLSYLGSGFIPLFPYIVLGAKNAFLVSIGLSLAALFILGMVSGKLFGANLWRDSVRMLIVGGCAIGVGVAAGKLIL